MGGGGGGLRFLSDGYCNEISHISAENVDILSAGCEGEMSEFEKSGSGGYIDV